MTSPHLPIVASIGAFALAGGWCASRAVAFFTSRPLPVLVTIAGCAALAIWAFEVTGWTAIFPVSLLLASSLFTLAAVDATAFLLPDLLTLPLAAAGIAVAVFILHDSVLDHLAGAAIGAGAFAAIGWVYARLRRREGLGFGDAKLAGAAGAWLGWVPLPSVILIACAGGLLWVMGKTVIRGGEALGERVPFGVALAIAIWIVWLYGPLELFAA